MENDVLTKEFFSDDARYADLINGLGCDGKQIVRKEDLQELDTQTGVWKTAFQGKKGRRKVRDRDLVRRTAFGVNFAVIGIENQEVIDYALSLRNMSYDVSEYEKQTARIKKEVRNDSTGLTAGEYLYGFKKDSKLHPVVTFVLYYGKEAWDGATDLHSIIDFEGIPDEIKKLVQNFKVHVVEVRKLEDTSMFQTDVRQVFDIIRYSEEPDKLKELMEKEAAYQNMEEDAYDMVAAYTHVEELINMKNFHRKKGGKVDMCGAIAGLIAEGKLEGKLEGRQEGKLEGEESKLIEQVCKKLRKNKSAAVIAEELEEEQERIESICEAAKAYAPEFDCDKVYQAWKGRI